MCQLQWYQTVQLEEEFKSVEEDTHQTFEEHQEYLKALTNDSNGSSVTLMTEIN